MTDFKIAQMLKDLKLKAKEKPTGFIFFRRINKIRLFYKGDID